MKDNESPSNKGFWAFFINKRPLTWLVTFSIIGLGAYSALTIPQEIQPEINIPIVAIQTALPGANPADTESLITDPIEEAIANYSEVDKLESTSRQGSSNVVVTINSGADIDKAVQEIKDRLDLVKNDLPEDATDPIVIRFEGNSTPIINFSIVGPYPLFELTEIGDEIKDELKNIEGIDKIEVLGGQTAQVTVKVDPQKANQYNLGLEQIFQLIKAANLNLPVGLTANDQINYSISIDNRFQSVDEIRNMVLTTLPDENHTIIYLKDIAEVKKDYSEKAIISRLSVSGKEPNSSVTIQVFKEEGANIPKVVDKAKEKIEDLKTTIIPKNVDTAITNDFSVYIRNDLGVLKSSGIQTTILIVIILFLSLGFYEGILAGLSIPLSLLATFIFLQAYGLTLNSLTLFSLVISVGLMVDTAIVIMEGIHENRKKGLNAKESAIASVKTYKAPLIAGTLTTVFAFAPMLLVSGIVGQFLRTLPITIGATLLSSIAISLTILPSITAKFLQKSEHKEKSSILEPVFHKIGSWFENFIRGVLSKRIFRVLVVLFTLGLFVASMTLPARGILKVEMFPKTDVQFFIINIEAIKGLEVAETEKIVTNVESYLYDIPEIDNFISLIGTSQSQTPTDIVEIQGSANSNIANITVNLVDAEERERRSYEIANEVRDKVSQITDARVEIRETSEGPPQDAAITARITGDNIETLKQISAQVEEIFNSTSGTSNVDTSIKEGLAEFRYKLKPERLSFHGLSTAEAAIKIRNSLQGVKSTDVTIQDEDLSVMVQYDLKSKNQITQLNVSGLEAIEIQSPKGYSVSFGEIAELNFIEGISSIQREDQKRIFKVRSDVESDANSVDVTAKIKEETDKIKLPQNYEISFGGDTEEIDESFQDLFESMIVAVILIAFTLVVVFNSLKQPFIILLTLPMALIGVFPGLMSVGLALSFPAFLGIVALAGVVVNDAIVLIDRINQSRKKGMEFTQSIAEAANSRLQPIIMTSITTIVGILPVALVNEFWAGLGFSLIFGLAAGTFLTLIVIPVLYYMFEERANRKSLAN